MTTVHNGRRYRCVCYPYDTKFTIPPYDSVGNENPYELVPQGDSFIKVHYELTDEKNGTVIAFQVKRHNRMQFDDAVREQLMYVKGIIYETVDEDGTVSRHRTEKPVLHSSDHVIVSESTIYHSPHIVIVKSPKDQAGICYGMVDFKELEMQQMYGSIGFKCPIRQSYRDDNGVEIVLQEGVSVTPSRERVIWNEDTKAYVLKVIRAAEIEASTLISASVRNVTTITDWLETCRQVASKAFVDNTSILGRLANIIDRTKVDVSHPRHPELIFSSSRTLTSVLGFFTFEEVTMDSKGQISINELSMMNARSWKHIYWKDANYSKTRNMYLVKMVCGGSFITCKRKEIDAAEQLKLKASLTKYEELEQLTDLVEFLLKEDPMVLSYGGVTVPEDYEKEVQKVAEIEKLDDMSPADRRRLEQREVAFTIRKEMVRYSATYVLDKVEPRRVELLDPKDEVYWFLKEEKEQVFRLLQYIEGDLPKEAAVFRYGNYSTPAYCTLWSTVSRSLLPLPDDHEPVKGPTFIQIRQELSEEVHGDNLMHWTSMFRFRNGNTYTAHPLVIAAFTRARLKNFACSDEYSYLRSFDINPHIRSIANRMFKFEVKGKTEDAMEDPIFADLHRMQRFHVSIMSGLSEEERRDLSFRTFGLTDIEDAVVLDEEILDRADELRTFVEPVHQLCSNMDSRSFSDPLVQKELIRYLALYDRHEWDWGAHKENIPEETVTI